MIGREAHNERKREMRKDLLPYYLQNITIRGFEDDDKKDDKDDKSKGSDDDDDDDDSGDDKGEKGDKDSGNEGLKSALRKERQERRRLDKELKAALKFKEDAESKDKTETDKAKDSEAKATAKAEKLATKLRTNAVDTEIIKLGTKLKFRDLDDALKLVNRDDIEIDQDEEDPSDITIDSKTVEQALKDLAKAKPHLLVAEGSTERSGSKFAGGKKSQDELDDEAIKAKYPALARSSHKS